MVIQIKVPIKNSIVKLIIIVIIIKSSGFVPLRIKDSFNLKAFPIHLNSTCNSTIKITWDFPSFLFEEGRIINLVIITIIKVVIVEVDYIA